MIVVRDTVRLNGKGNENIHEYLHCEMVSVMDTHRLLYDRHNTVVFHISEDRTPNLDRFRIVAALARKHNPKVRIWNDPSDYHIANKHETMERVIEKGGIPNVKMPKHWRITCEADLARVSTFPCIVRKLRGSGGAGAMLAATPAAMASATKKLGEFPLQVVEYVLSDRRDGLIATVRLNWVGNLLVDFWCRPSKKWNNHAADTHLPSAVAYDDEFRVWLGRRDVPAMLTQANKVFGLGWYSMDVVWSQDSLWFCECGYKLFDNCHHGHLKDVEWNVPKRTENEQAVLEAACEEVWRWDAS